MKRLRLWLRELSLSQQLLAIVFLVVSAFVVFFFVFLSGSIDTFAENEMYKLLHNSQESMIYYLDENPGIEPKFGDTAAGGIAQALYDKEENSFLMLNSSAALSAETKDSIRGNIALGVSGTRDYSVTVTDAGVPSTSYLYSITETTDGRYLVSLMTDTYREEFRNSLVKSVINMNVLVVGILFLILTMWVASLIHPLNMIKAYIERIKKDEPAELNIDRRDEIGEVATALVDMEDELQKQTRVKEEMIQNISHDLKTPIATIKSYAESIKDGVYPYETLEKSVDVIIEHADRLEKKVHSLIVLNKMGYLLDECPEGDALDMNAVIEKAILSLKVIRPEIHFIRTLDEGVKFHGEEDPWRIVVENLVDNALRYAKTYIQITLHEGELCVINDGKPISEDRLEKLFKPYEKGTDGKFGLGLSIVYRVATTYGYKVDAENLKDGVCFRIWRTISKKEMRARRKELEKETKEKQKEIREIEKETRKVVKNGK